MRGFYLVLSVFVFVIAPPVWGASAKDDSATVRLKDIARIEGLRDNQLVGYGIVAGLAGTGDTIRSRATLQSIANALARFDLRVSPEQLNSRNVAAVMLTATLPPYSHVGNKLDVNVASIGDARSLLGGTLFMTPLRGPDGEVYALAQGPLSVGGYRYDAFGNVIQKNHPTVGVIPDGAIVEATPERKTLGRSGDIHILLDNPDFTTSSRILHALGEEFGSERIQAGDIVAMDAGHLIFGLRDDERRWFVDMLRRIENVRIVPDQTARIVVNERTGTVVSGGDVRINSVTVTHGELQVDIDTDFLVSQPSPFLGRVPDSIRTEVVPDTQIKVDEPANRSVALPAGTRVADLVAALNDIEATPRDIISILQGIKQAGALHAELIIR